MRALSTATNNQTKRILIVVCENLNETINPEKHIASNKSISKVQIYISKVKQRIKAII